MRELWLNGRVLARPGGGVRRYASEIADHLRCRVASPPSARFPWSARAWEQSVLAARTRHGVLLNVAHGAPLTHRRSVVVVHDLFALDRPTEVRPSFARLMATQLPAIVRQAAVIVAVSDSVADQVAERFDLSRAAVSIAAPGVSTSFVPGDRVSARQRLGLDPDRPTVVALVGATPRKQPNRLAAALGRIAAQRSDVQIVTAGRTAAGVFAPSQIAPMALWPGRHLHQPDDATLASLYQSADVVLCASGVEGFGLPPVEAAACGVAVVSPAVPSLDTHPDAAIVVPGDPEALASATLGLLGDDQARRDQAGQAAGAVAGLTWKATGAALSAASADLCGEPQRLMPTRSAFTK